MSDEKIEVWDNGFAALYRVRYSIDLYASVADHDGCEHIAHRAQGAWKLMRPAEVIGRLANADRLLVDGLGLKPST